jgi:biopolymer transport protein ExbB
MMNRILSVIFVAGALIATTPAFAQESANTAGSQRTLDELLAEVERAVVEGRRINREREQRFIQQRNRQRQLLAEARAELREQEALSDRLRETANQNEQDLIDLSAELQERQGNLGEMFGTVRTAASELASQLEGSITSAQYPGRTEFLLDLAQRNELATVPELRRMWFEMQREVTVGGKVEEFTAPVLDASGIEQAGQTVVRVGVFNAIANGDYLRWDSTVGTQEGMLAVVTPQPESRFSSTAEGLQSANPGSMATFGLDPTRGQILSLVVQNPNLLERINQGGPVGYVILGLGAIGVLFALLRGLILLFRGMAIKSQMKRSEADEKNALGRVMKVYEDNPNTDVETLELKLDEAILREAPRIEFGLGFVKILYVVAPLLGLLGTVTGMIVTFQQIVLFGTGDPRTMAGGISMALVTTVLGLVVAIPLTLIHSVLQSRANALIHILEEQSAGVIARVAEKRDAGSARNR